MIGLELVGEELFGVVDNQSRRKLHLIHRWAAFTDHELLALVGALDQVEARAPLARLDTAAAEALSDEIGAEIQRREAGAPRS